MSHHDGTTTHDALDQFAELRGLDPDRLRGWGVRAVGSKILIEYRDLNGDLLFVKTRNPPGVEPRFNNPKGQSLIPYGLGHLERARKEARLYLTEGESDCWALWAGGFPALGLPGANSAGCLDLEHLSCIAEVFVCRDSDPAGEKFAEAVHARLIGVGYVGTMRVLWMPPETKDIGELYQSDPAGFRDNLADVVAEAPPVRMERPADPKPKVDASKPHALAGLDFTPLTDDGNGRRLAKRSGDHLRHLTARKRWVVWDASHWRFDDTDEVLRLAKAVMREMVGESLKALSDLNKEEG